MLALTLKHPNRTVFDAEFDQERGVVFADGIEALDILTVVPVLYGEGAPHSILMDVMAVMIAPLDDAFHPNDKTQKAIREHYEQAGVHLQSLAAIENSNPSVIDYGDWQSGKYFLESSSILHTDAAKWLQWTRAEDSTIVVPRFGKGRMTGHEASLIHSPHYWLQAKDKCLTAFRGAYLGMSYACPHMRPLTTVPRKAIIQSLCMSKHPYGNELAALRPEIMSARAISEADAVLKPRILRREHIPQRQLAAA